MFEIASRLLERLDRGERLAVATAVAITGSAPRTVGTSMALTEDGAVLGSIAGGCVEGAVVELAEQVIATGSPQTATFGISDDQAFAVGLSCGGRITIAVDVLRPTDDAAQRLRDAAAGRAAAHPTLLAPPPSWPRLPARLAAEVQARLALGRSGTVSFECDGERLDAFVEVAVPPARFVIVGAMEFSAALAAAASVLGYAVTVCDPRPLFATPERFPGAEVVVEWPTEYLARTDLDERSVVCVLSHDDRFDVDLLRLALELPVAYVGAMGSRRTHDRRVAGLAALGVTDLSRLHSPIGLDVGASTPEETAVSILAEVLTVRTGSAGRSLRDRDGAIHAR